MQQKKQTDKKPKTRLIDNKKDQKTNKKNTKQTDTTKKTDLNQIYQNPNFPKKK